MARRRVAISLCLLLAGAASWPVHAVDALVPPTLRAVDPAKAKAQEMEKQRLLAKLQADAPQLVETRAATHPLDAPIFHRYDRP
jgi:hypothetical protein